MSMRLSRVEETVRRAVAEILVRGDLRDPRLQNAAAISITAVKISPDLGSAQVYVDVLSGTSIRSVLDALNAGASAIRAKLGGRLRLKRTPSLRFVVDRSIEQGRKIEAVLAELHAQEAAPDEAEPDQAAPDQAAPDEPDEAEPDEAEPDAPEPDDPSR